MAGISQISFRPLIMATVVLALLASACGAGEAAAPTPPAERRSEVLDFTAPKLGGGSIDGADYAGENLAIWFWAPW